MGMFDAFKANMLGNRALRAHTAAQQAARKGNDEKREDQYALAKQLYSEAVEAGCVMPRVLMSYSVLLMRDGDLEKAKNLMLQAEKTPGLSDVDKKQLLINYSVCQWKMGNIEKAIELIRNAEKRGKNATIYMMLSHLLIKQAEQTGDFSAADAYVQEAYDYDPDDPEAIDVMGQLYLAKGDWAKAKEYFTKAVEKDDNQGWSHVFLAQIAKQQGDLEEEKKQAAAAVKGSFHLMSPISKNEAREYAKTLGIE